MAGVVGTLDCCDLLVRRVLSSHLWSTSPLLRPSGQQFRHSGGVCTQIQGCCMFVSCVHPVAVLNAVFCITCRTLICSLIHSDLASYCVVPAYLIRTDTHMNHTSWGYDHGQLSEERLCTGGIDIQGSRHRRHTGGATKEPRIQSTQVVAHNA